MGLGQTFSGGSAREEPLCSNFTHHLGAVVVSS